MDEGAHGQGGGPRAATRSEHLILFVPHGKPPPLEWMARHPGWVKFPATLVPRASPIVGRWPVPAALQPGYAGMSASVPMATDAAMAAAIRALGAMRAPAVRRLAAAPSPVDPGAAVDPSDSRLTRWLHALNPIGTAQAQDEPLAGPAVAEARVLYKTLQAEIAQTESVEADLGVAELTQRQRDAVTKIENVVRNHAQEKDFTGVASELAGFDTGFDHITEMKNSLNSLKNQIGSIEGSLKNPQLGFAKPMLERALARAKVTVNAMKKALGVE